MHVSDHNIEYDRGEMFYCSKCGLWAKIKLTQHDWLVFQVLLLLAEIKTFMKIFLGQKHVIMMEIIHVLDAKIRKK